MEAMVELIVCMGLVGVLMLTVGVAYGVFVLAIRHSHNLSVLMERLFNSLPMSQDDWD